MTSSLNNKLKNIKNRVLPKNWLKISTIDMHIAGEPLRIILDGLPELEGDTILVGSEFTGRIAKTTKFGDYNAVIPEVEGNAYVKGKHEFIIDPDDPLKNGFILR
jgi:proline racemase